MLSSKTFVGHSSGSPIKDMTLKIESFLRHSQHVQTRVCWESIGISDDLWTKFLHGETWYFWFTMCQPL